MDDHLPQRVRVERRAVTEAESRRANGPDWDRYADEYQATHGDFLGDTGFVWGPEGLREEDAGVLGDVAGKDVLELGSGPASARAGSGCAAAGPTASTSRCASSSTRGGSTTSPGSPVPSVLATATQIPYADAAFDVVFCSFGALQFVADLEQCLAEVARVLRRGGRFAFSVTHPTRWSFPDDPSEAGLTATASYWDRTPYVEIDDESGRVAYVEHHRTLGDWVALLAPRFRIVALLEPEWPEGHDRVWGGWSRVRGRLTPGTAIFAADLA